MVPPEKERKVVYYAGAVLPSLNTISHSRQPYAPSMSRELTFIKCKVSLESTYRRTLCIKRASKGSIANVNDINHPTGDWTPHWSQTSLKL
jgi:hypothetical protein